jgi:hypothetical protein
MTERMENAEEKTESLVDNAIKLKKAGFSLVLVVALTVAGAPGFWEFFFNDTDKVAAVKAEMSYQLLKSQTEKLVEQIQANHDESVELRRVVTALLMQRAAVGYNDAQLPAPAPTPQFKPLPATLDGLVDRELATENPNGL